MISACSSEEARTRVQAKVSLLTFRPVLIKLYSIAPHGLGRAFGESRKRGLPPFRRLSARKSGCVLR